MNTASKHRTTNRILLAALASAFAVALPSALSPLVTPPPVPDSLQVPAGNKAYLEGHAFGTQNYSCLPSGSGFAWILFGPQANLFDDDDELVITHFLSPNPFESGTPRATWQHSRDTSAVWALPMVPPSFDPKFVAPGAIPWLLLQVVGAQDGPTGGNKMTATTFIHRVNTVGGIAPSTGCAVSTDVGKKALVPYQADYVFYKYRDGADDDN